MDDSLREFLTETSERRLDGQLIVVLDVDRVLEIVPKTALAD
jgi:hypothetical protein